MRKLALALSLFIFGCAPSHLKGPQLPINAPALRQSWSRALTLAGSQGKGWKTTPPVFLIPTVVWTGPERRLLGDHRLAHIVSANGQLELDERIFIFLQPEETEKLLPRVLDHEFLHALWWRRAFTEPEFTTENPDSEVWVCSLVDCNVPG